MISNAVAIVEHIKQEIVERMTEKTPLQLSYGNESIAGPGYKFSITEKQPISSTPGGIPGISYTIMAFEPREFIAAGWLDESTQIIILYHDIDEAEVQMRASQWFTSIGETAVSTGPSQMM